jgi:hypothetical protein
MAALGSEPNAGNLFSSIQILMHPLRAFDFSKVVMPLSVVSLSVSAAFLNPQIGEKQEGPP